METEKENRLDTAVNMGIKSVLKNDQDIQSENRLETVKNLALDELIGFFQNKENDDVAILRADKATDSLSSVSRIMATERVKESTKLNIIKTITDDPVARAKYIEMTLPQYFPNSIKKLN